VTPSEQELVAIIRRAFAGVRLDDGVSLNMTEYKDSGGCAPEFEKKAQYDERDDWTAIPDKILEHFTVTFSFTDLKGFRFYIPAYMIWAIRNHRESRSIIANYTIYAIDPSHYLFETIPFWQWFTAEQIDAMTKFLEYAVQDGDTLDDRVARENLAKIRMAGIGHQGHE
jgi:hypothetical protein